MQLINMANPYFFVKNSQSKAAFFVIHIKWQSFCTLYGRYYRSDKKAKIGTYFLFEMT